MSDFIVVGNISDDPFSLDMASLCGQSEDISDVISLKSFANTEFCPRFIVHDEKEFEKIGEGLSGKTVIICSTVHHQTQSRNALAMRTMIIANAAKENGAKKVILIEPDLFYSAQDRGPNLSDIEDSRSTRDLKKFDGQSFTARMYASLLKTAGIDVVVTVHNHSLNVQREFSQTFNGEFYNLCPAEVYADYIKRSDMVVTGKDGDNLILCAPDNGAVPFAIEVMKALDLPKSCMVIMAKERSGERQVELQVKKDSPCSLADIKGKDVIVLDDMVRTGGTIIECCKLLAQGKPNKLCFGVTHFYASPEGRVTLNAKVLDEILTLNSIPSILNRDMQGRLRKKMVVLKIEKWIAKFILEYMQKDSSKFEKDFYTGDMSSKNPRWRPSSIF
ncbi:MAG: ribose-phosphate pyrophosphokinase [Fibrobacteria bacterium]|nr:ribose-phosphate pyrophosphokinase [Fibrobacteria bacterium]